jgi:hypothetical protein
MKYFFLGLIALCASVQVSAQANLSHSNSDSLTDKSTSKKKKEIGKNSDVLRPRAYTNDPVNLEEGYTQLAGGAYVVKDFLVKGPINLICIYRGMAMSTGSLTPPQATNHYYLTSSTQSDLYREIFLTTKKTSAVLTTAQLLTGPAQFHGDDLTSAGSSSSMIDRSKSLLKELMKDDTEVVAKIDAIKRLTLARLKSTIKLYNKNRQAR